MEHSGAMIVSSDILTDLYSRFGRRPQAIWNPHPWSDNDCYVKSGWVFRESGAGSGSARSGPVFGEIRPRPRLVPGLGKFHPRLSSKHLSTLVTAPMVTGRFDVACGWPDIGRVWRRLAAGRSPARRLQWPAGVQPPACPVKSGDTANPLIACWIGRDSSRAPPPRVSRRAMTFHDMVRMNRVSEKNTMDDLDDLANAYQAPRSQPRRSASSKYGKRKKPHT